MLTSKWNLCYNIFGERNGCSFPVKGGGTMMDTANTIQLLLLVIAAINLGLTLGKRR
ncbi:MAG: hypothetical protein LUC38_09075 [Oscillospiraceae bacterium]|nr:hypothetical protein [Oscillospiraceae bacterium]